ncbi:NAD(+)/NADH kinase [Halobaculum magnesiiphilum]|uniref:NAD kinase n=1 Tax=Halobaculum magnesiiphilum TaxID=1017351 RepID=A0A8T8WC09_9EURY|nr:NAD(+)/NADH kinase [Halobaculum magnesiiphilum]QZP37375.1 NAD(+)/NADH kinase [Halobaculum magnesiiphilum]
MEVGIVAQRGNNRAAYLAEDLRDRLRAADVRVAVDEATADALDLDGVPVSAMDGVDLVVSIGGDGTFLFAARGAGGVPILGVNLGEVGFLNAVSPGEAVDAVLDEVEAFRGEGMHVREAPRLAAACDGWHSEPAANEIVVQGGRRGRGGGVGYEVRVDGSLYSSGHADGVLVSTPTGSTAYNLSEGGPLVHPSVDGLVVTEMCAEDGMPPLVTGPDASVSLTLTDAEEAIVITDGRGGRSFDVPTEVTVATTEPPVRIAGPSADFFEALGKLE